MSVINVQHKYKDNKKRTYLILMNVINVQHKYKDNK
jgi:hypothetical protein